jgi:chaperone required for assembly of F1-ATPase
MSNPSGAPPRDLKAALVRPKPKRFYAMADAALADGQWQILLDGRSARTPLKRPLALEGERIARAIAAEWSAQGTEIDTASMPLTTLACTAIDTVADNAAAVAEEIAAYAMSDLLCYRAEAPDGLIARQAAHWDPILAWANSTFSVRFVTSRGLMPVGQEEALRDAVRTAASAHAPLALAGLHVLTTLSGSAVLALALASGRLSLDELWVAAHIDEDWQIERWGTDAEAAARRAHRRRDAEAAALVLLRS